MPRTQTLVQLSDALLAALDQRAAQRKVSRSQIIREAITAHLGGDHEAEVSRQILVGYERWPQAEPDAWGNPNDAAAVSARGLHRRLDAEERAAGVEPW